MTNSRIHRRRALQLGACAALAISPAARLLARDFDRHFSIGACDWSIGRTQQLSALALAKEIGLDGVQVSFGEKGGRYDLRKPEVRQEYAEACEKLNVRIASLAMGVLNSRPYASDADAEQWVADCIDVMAAMKQKVVLLAFFGDGDIKDKPESQQQVITRLKKVAPRAEQAGVVLGIESWLNADEHLRILDAVGSPAVKVYYDVANMELRGYDIYKEIRQLGRERICEVHAKENDSLLGQGRVDFLKVKEALYDIGWDGWLIIESASPAGRSVAENYKRNRQYLRSIFPA